jgi:hypothetical protein
MTSSLLLSLILKQKIVYGSISHKAPQQGNQSATGAPLETFCGGALDCQCAQSGSNRSRSLEVLAEYIVSPPSRACNSSTNWGTSSAQIQKLVSGSSIAYSMFEDHWYHSSSQPEFSSLRRQESVKRRSPVRSSLIPLPKIFRQFELAVV